MKGSARTTAREILTAGRNDPRPCGSGKKSKKCCGAANTPGPDRTDPAALLRQAVAAHRDGRMDDAEGLYRRVLAAEPRNPDALHLLGMVAHQRGEHAEAERLLRESIAVSSAAAAFHLDLGKVLKKMGRTDESIACCREAIRLQPDLADGYYNLANELSARGAYEEAVGLYRETVRLRPDHSFACNNLSLALRSLGRTEEALQYARLAVQAEPANAEAWNNMGVLCSNSGLPEESVHALGQAAALRPGYREALWNLAHPLLQRGEFILGWKCYDLRHLSRDASLVGAFPYPRWDGSPLEGGTLFIYSEQGVGDEIMFASVLNDVLPLAKRCIVECSDRLVPLFSRSFPGAAVIPLVRKDSPGLPSGIDAAIPIGSLPRYFRQDLRSFPRRRSYLVPDPDAAARWRGRFQALGPGLKAGISWRGGNEPSVQHLRSTKLDQWADIFRVPGVHFINLQYGDCSREIEDARQRLGTVIAHWADADPLKDLDGFAAQISALDLVITVDNSTLHMAGSLGIPAWALIPKGNNWRWLQNAEDTPWYSDLRLFNQAKLHDWLEPFQRIADLLGRAARDRAIIPELTVAVSSSYQERK